MTKDKQQEAEAGFVPLYAGGPKMTRRKYPEPILVSLDGGEEAEFDRPVLATWNEKCVYFSEDGVPRVPAKGEREVRCTRIRAPHKPKGNFYWIEVREI